jgi:hypothetical protein
MSIPAAIPPLKDFSLATLLRLILNKAVDGTRKPLFVDERNQRVGVGLTSLTSPFGVASLPQYANNAAALLGGLTAGAFYRTGGDPDAVCVVH